MQKGDRVVTSGGDRIFPKGLQIGVIKDISRGGDGFYNLTVTPAANLNRLEEVLIVTEINNDSLMAESNEAPQRAAELLAKRLPTVKKNPANELKDEQENPLKKSTPPSTAPEKSVKPVTPAAPAAAPKIAPAQAKADQKQEQPVR